MPPPTPLRAGVVRAYGVHNPAGLPVSGPCQTATAVEVCRGAAKGLIAFCDRLRRGVESEMEQGGVGGVGW